MDPIDADLHTSAVFKFSDMTSNQAIVQGQASNPARAQILEDAVQSVTSKRAGVPQDQLVEEILDTLVSGQCVFGRSAGC